LLLVDFPSFPPDLNSIRLRRSGGQGRLVLL
jgi:hypothetical protein